MKKAGRILVAILLVISVTWSAVSTFLLYRSSHTPTPFKPVITRALGNTQVGQMRMNRLWKITLKEKDFVDFEFLGLERGVVSGPPESVDGYDLLRIKITLREEVYDQDLVNFRIFRYCPEDDFWYAIYVTEYPMMASARDVSGEIVEEYHVPPDIMAEPGTYAFRIDALGTFQFEIE